MEERTDTERDSLSKLHWSSLLKFTKASKRLGSSHAPGTLGMRIGPIIVASA